MACLVSACASSSSGGQPSSDATSTSTSTSDASGLPSAETGLSYDAAGDALNSIMGPLNPVQGDTVRGIQGKVVTIAGVADVTAGGELANPGACAGAQARFARADREGGVNGYTFKYVGCSDDQTSPSVTQQAVQTAVLKDKAFALVPLSAYELNAKVLTEQHVPFFAGAAYGAAYCGWNDSPYGFSYSWAAGCLLSPSLPNKEFLGSFDIDGYAHTLPASEQGKNIKWAFVANNIPVAKNIMTAFGEVAKSEGMTVAYDGVPIPGPTSPPLSDYTPIAQDIIHSGANVVLLAVGGASAFGLDAALKANGYTGAIEATIGYDDPSVLSNPQLTKIVEGAIAVNAWGGVAGPGIDQIASDLKAINSKVSATASSTLWSYGAADFFLSAFAKVQGPMTAEKLTNLINGGFSYPGIPDTLCPSQWPAAHYIQSNCASAVKIGPNGTTTTVLPLGTYGANYLVNN
jgi:ABC-type branched-subunit amino acid transport system substrate-binding protein